jgi:hypothetical protein
MHNLLINIVGFAGAALLILAYFLNSSKKIESDSFTYQALNFVGAIMALCNAWFFGAYPAVAINIFWVGICFYSALRWHRKSQVM